MSEWKGLIRGEIAEIIDEYTVILNIGIEHGVKRDMRFVVYAETDHIFDRLGRDLGVLEIPKAEVEVKDVQEKLSVAKSARIVEIPSPLEAADVFGTMLGRKQVLAKLPVEKDQIKEIKVDLHINKGDKVRQVL